MGTAKLSPFLIDKRYYALESRSKFTSVILVEDIPHVGERGEIVKVKKGFARNQLFPKLMAVYDTKENRDKFEPYTKLIDFEARERRKKLESYRRRLGKITVKFKRHVIAPGVTHGAIRAFDIVQKLKKQYNIQLEPTNIILPTPITNTLGVVEVPTQITLDDGQILETNLKLEIKKR